MDMKPLSPELTVSEQLLPGDLQMLKDKGVRGIICNRPDGEGPDQPSFDEIKAAARDIGLEAAYVPVIPGKVTEADVAAFTKALAELPGPVHAFCRTGARSSLLWSMTQKTQSPA